MNFAPGHASVSGQTMTHRPGVSLGQNHRVVCVVTFDVIIGQLVQFPVAALNSVTGLDDVLPSKPAGAHSIIDTPPAEIDVCGNSLFPSVRPVAEKTKRGRFFTLPLLFVGIS